MAVGLAARLFRAALPMAVAPAVERARQLVARRRQLKVFDAFEFRKFAGQI